ncbi:hypothetical protein GCM10029992_03190 [Glycomyces albus]
MAAKFPYDDLQSFLDTLEADGELKRVSAEVDPNLEISEITQRVIRDGGPALLFENPAGSDMPLAINLFGTFPGWPPRSASTTSTRSVGASASWPSPSSRSAGPGSATGSASSSN